MVILCLPLPVILVLVTALIMGLFMLGCQTVWAKIRVWYSTRT
jgi:hypothetical protein